jgi:hypothetical protein
MTTALLLIIPAVLTLILGITARSVIGGEVPDLEPISSVWPTVVEALPPADIERHDRVPVHRAA